MADADDRDPTTTTTADDVDAVGDVVAPPGVAAPVRRPLVAGEIVARRGFWFLLQRCIAIPLLLVGGGAYFLYDGFVGWPGSNQHIADLTAQAEQAKARGDLVEEAALLNKRKEIKPRTDLDILIQRLLGFTLAPVGLVAMVWFPYRSRGRYRLTADDVLHVPGHPPVPASAVTEMDKRLFDRKGIVHLTYALADGAATATLTLDDFVYNQDPTDQIIDRIEAVVSPVAEAATGAAPPPAAHSSEPTEA